MTKPASLIGRACIHAPLSFAVCLSLGVSWLPDLVIEVVFGRACLMLRQGLCTCSAQLCSPCDSGSHLVIVVRDEPLLVRRILLSDSQLPPHSLHLDAQRVRVPQPRLRQLSVALRRSLRQHSDRLRLWHPSARLVPDEPLLVRHILLSDTQLPRTPSISMRSASACRKRVCASSLWLSDALCTSTVL